MRGILFIIFIVWAGNVFATNDRIALVIGNSKYSELGTLSNTANDAKKISASLAEMGYKTKLVLDKKEGDLRKDLKAFANESENASIAIVYYAGHGAQVNGENYLLPVDIDVPKRESDIQLSAVKVDDIINSLKSKTKVVFLDACRDNPALVKSLSKGRGVYRGGLAPANSSSLNDQSSGIFIAYATDAGNVALDGEGKQNSPFTTALLKYMKQPISIDDMFSMVTKEVRQETKNQQKPYKYASLEGIICLPGECKPVAIDVTNVPTSKAGSATLDKPTMPKNWVLYGFFVDPKKMLNYVNPASIEKNGNRVSADLKWVESSSNPTTDYVSAVYDCNTRYSNVYQGKKVDVDGKVLSDQIWGDKNTVALITDLSDPKSAGYNVVNLFCNPEKNTPIISPSTLNSGDWVRFYSIKEGQDMYYLRSSIKKSVAEPEVIVRFSFGKEIPFAKLQEHSGIAAGYESFSNTPLVSSLISKTKFQCSDKTNYATIENFINDRGELVVYYSFANLPPEQRAKTIPGTPFGQLSEMLCK